MRPARAITTLVPIAAVLALIATTLPLGVRWHAVATLAVAVVGCLWVAAGLRRRESHSTVGRLVGAAAALNLAGSLVWLAPALTGADDILAQPWPAAVAWIAGNLLLAAAIVLALTQRESPRVVLLDTVCIVVAAGLVVGLVLVEPVLSDGAVPLASRVLHAARFVADIALIAAVARVLLAPRGRPLSLWLLAAAAGGMVVSDIFWKQLLLLDGYAPSSALGWTVAPLLLGLAALHPSMRRFGVAEDRTDADLRMASALVFGLTSLSAPLLLGGHALVPALPDIDENFGASLTMLIGGSVLAITFILRFMLLVRRTRALAATNASALDEGSVMLERSEARYRALIEEFPAVVILYALRADRLVPVYVSPKAESICGITAEDWLARPDEAQQCIHPDDLVMLQMKLADQAMGTKTNDLEFRFRRPDGEEIWLRDVSGVVTEEPDGRYLHAMLVDVTKFKRASRQRAAQETDVRLSQKLEAVGQLAAGIAHEINTPIQFVGDTIRFLQDAFTDLLELTTAHEALRDAAEAGPVAPVHFERVREVEEMADLEYLRERVPAAFERGAQGISRVAEIVRAMRDFAHPPTLEKAPLDVVVALKDTLIVAANAFKYIADVETDFTDVPSILGNVGELNQVFLNLVVNAAHAIEGVVDESGERGLIRIVARRDGDDVVVSISDTGGGIPAEIADRVFDPFFTTKDVGRGTGQGLALARVMVVERHAGTLTFDSVPGVGTTFHIRLPIGAPALVAVA